MISISVPMAVSIAAATVPSTVALIVASKRLRNRKKQKIAAQKVLKTLPEGAGFGHEMYQQLLEQQIDTIFNSFSILIEAECVKLKAVARSWSAVAPHASSPAIQEVVNPSDAPVMQVAAPAADAPQGRQPSDQILKTGDLGQQISACIEKGMSRAEIARELNLSQVEVSLALQLRGVDQGLGKNRRKLEAVA